jgi:hypothetical protein
VESRFEEVQYIDSLKIKLLFCESLLEKYTLDREENQRFESTSMRIRDDRQITETMGKNCVSLALLFNYLLIIFPRICMMHVIDYLS